MWIELISLLYMPSHQFANDSDLFEMNYYNGSWPSDTYSLQKWVIIILYIMANDVLHVWHQIIT